MVVLVAENIQDSDRDLFAGPVEKDTTKRHAGT